MQLFFLLAKQKIGANQAKRSEKIVTAVGWPKLDTSTELKCHSLCNKLLQ
jgi:hypothetical protein